jgi:hypothetical protein
MSVFSFISFPRKVDTSCLKSRVDKSKHFLLGDIKGTEIENQVLDVFRQRSTKDIPITLEDLRNLPDEVGVYLGDISDYHGISILDQCGATFNDVFANPFIYDFYGEFTNYNHRSNTDSDFIRRLKEGVYDNDTLCRQQLCDVVQANLKPNEFIELYADWIDDNNSFNFGPPEYHTVIDAEQILTSELLGNDNTGIKIEIRRTK